MTEPQHTFLHSRLIDAEEVRRVGSFSTLPVRINLRDDLAHDAASKVLKDWNKYIGDGKDENAHLSMGPLGNLCSFLYPEALPERLGSLTYLTDFGTLFDGKQYYFRISGLSYAV
jgi:ophiobolin F synthase